MEEKKEFKISLGMLVMIIVIVLIIITGVWYYVFVSNENANLNSINTINSEEQEKIVNKVNEVTGTENINSNTSKTEDFLVIYNGTEISKKPGVQTLDYIPKKDKDDPKYKTTYYVYRSGEYMEEANKDIKMVEVYENNYYLEGFFADGNMTSIAISKKYNAVPRKAEVISLEQIMNQLLIVGKGIDEGHTIYKVDLDGDGTNEYLSITRQIKGRTCHSEINLFDSNYNKIAMLAYMDVEGYEGGEPSWLSNMDFIDIDNDNIMEILINLPEWEGMGKLSIVKYNNGKITGETNVKASIEP